MTVSGREDGYIVVHSQIQGFLTARSITVNLCLTHTRKEIVTRAHATHTQAMSPTSSFQLRVRGPAGQLRLGAPTHWPPHATAATIPLSWVLQAIATSWPEATAVFQSAGSFVLSADAAGKVAIWSTTAGSALVPRQQEGAVTLAGLNIMYVP
jgi:hypothetical protein